MTRGNKYLHFRLFVFKHPVFIYQFRYKINEWKLLLFSIYNLHVISCASHNWASNWGATMVHYWKIRLPRISPPVDAPWTPWSFFCASLRRFISIYPDHWSAPLIHWSHAADLQQAAVYCVFSVILSHTHKHIGLFTETTQMMKERFLIVQE